ncbi:hypothetical protein [Cognatiyoonia sp. IB215182]|uniref:hypothetical protein n=1 Tax=Cognatiyoonia sp. IB215182 TaxID=3097353 RepID=UPI002A103329|nr:hypothetical protein [Cognatiyoonia sp. IB215182]MDX8355458.1 hypothetical protein [Cognatiyoonia sp. IB215182]
MLDIRYQEDPYRLVTPGRLFAMTGRKMQCGRCAKLVNEAITMEIQRLQQALPNNRTLTPQSGKD